jgi:hypothetical protein
VAGNVVVDGRGKASIRIALEAPPVGGSDNVVRKNVVKGSAKDGFLVNPKGKKTVLKRNVARGSGDDGFEVESPTTKLTGNRAVRNADLGIDAVRGVIDGGGNSARHNGDARQCRHLAC